MIMTVTAPVQCRPQIPTMVAVAVALSVLSSQSQLTAAQQQQQQQQQIDSFVNNGSGNNANDSEDSGDETLEQVLGFVLPIGILAMLVMLYCARHSIQRWRSNKTGGIGTNQQKADANAVRTALLTVVDDDDDDDGTTSGTWPFDFVLCPSGGATASVTGATTTTTTSDNDNDSVVCKKHKKELCTKEGCRVDYSLINQIRRRMDYKALQDTRSDKKARLKLVESHMTKVYYCYCNDDDDDDDDGQATAAEVEVVLAAAEGTVSPSVVPVDEETADDRTEQQTPLPATESSNLTVPIPQSILLLLNDQDPGRAVVGFASICYALKTAASIDEAERPNVDTTECSKLAIRAIRIVDEVSMISMEKKRRPATCMDGNIIQLQDRAQEHPIRSRSENNDNDDDDDELDFRMRGDTTTPPPSQSPTPSETDNMEAGWSSYIF